MSAAIAARGTIELEDVAAEVGAIVGAINAWGPTGPWGHKRGFDSIVQAVTGMAVVESPDGDRPGALPAQALDHAGGHFLAATLSHCLEQQRHEGAAGAPRSRSRACS